MDVEDVDCPGGTGDGPVYAPGRDFGVVGPDVYGLDADHDGIACETTSSATQPPTPPTTVSEAACHPSYVGVCLPIGVEDVDCPGGSGNGPVYAPARDFGVVGPDVYDLDRDGDGIACET